MIYCSTSTQIFTLGVYYYTDEESPSEDSQEVYEVEEVDFPGFTPFPQRPMIRSELHILCDIKAVNYTGSIVLHVLLIVK